MRIGIIGSAGRTRPWTMDLFLWARRTLLETIKEIPVKERLLISGGAAGADHLAVALYKANGGDLLLYMPALLSGEHDDTYPEFVSNGKFGAGNPGGTSNFYHQKFCEDLGLNKNKTLLSLQEMKKQDKCNFDYPGFHNRNLQVGRVDWLIAFTWAEGASPEDGGTLHTWNNSKAPKKTHISLSK